MRARSSSSRITPAVASMRLYGWLAFVGAVCVEWLADRTFSREELRGPVHTTGAAEKPHSCAVRTTSSGVRPCTQWPTMSWSFARFSSTRRARWPSKRTSSPTLVVPSPGTNRETRDPVALRWPPVHCDSERWPRPDRASAIYLPCPSCCSHRPRFGRWATAPSLVARGHWHTRAVAPALLTQLSARPWCGTLRVVQTTWCAHSGTGTPS
jgi:hypothetical protein